jgi:glyoxylase-like metal-dependent hydrolase (beta-lactamase superfamily II)
VIEVRGLTVGAFEENCWLLADREAGEAVLVDPGDEAERLQAAVEGSGCRLSAVWLTHAHLDHVGAIAALRRADPSLPVFLHPADLPLYRSADRQGAAYGLVVEAPPEPTQPLAEGMTLAVGGWRATVWHLPGHAPGHVAFVGLDRALVGDVLFAGSIGRTDLPLCDPRAMQRSLARLATLPDAIEVLSGHGPRTTIGRERVSNPFLVGLANPVGAGGAA